MIDALLQAHTESLKTAIQNQLSRLRELYPLGSRLNFTIMHGQKNWSTGIVAAYETSIYGGYVIVEHDQAKPGSRYKYRTVYVEKIISIEAVA